MTCFNATESNPRGSSSDVLCLLFPESPAAVRVIREMVSDRPQHVLFRDSSQYQLLDEFFTSKSKDCSREPAYQDASGGVCLALRKSSLRSLKSRDLGFAFGRNRFRADILCDQKHVSNVHFCICVDQDGDLVLRDSSTNGTFLNGRLLRSKDAMNQSCRMTTNSTICMGSSKETAVIRFSVIVPPDMAVPDQTLDDVSTGSSGVGTHIVIDRYGGPRANWDGGAKYHQTSFVGKGGFASVYKMSANKGDRVFAMKEVDKRPYLLAGKLHPKVHNEMKIMERLRHPNIVEYIDSHEEGNYIYIIMEFIVGGTLQEYLEKHETMHEPQVVEMCRQVFAALVYLHHLNITHRDLKPDNLLIVASDPIKIKVADFGLSKISIDRKTRLKTFCGTALYCAPEVYPDYSGMKTAKRQRSTEETPRYDSTVDIWSFGVVVWYAVCGKHPFASKTDENGRAMFIRVTTTPLDTTPLQQAGLPPPCLDLLMQMLQLEPTNRPPASKCLEHPWIKKRC